MTVLMGSRQTGKSTLVRSLPSLKDHLFLTLDRADIREQAQRDPHALLRSAPRVIIDEIQRDPALVLAIKEIVDQNAYAGQRAVGQFIVTGSANLLEMQRVNESLAGRAAYTTLWPMSRREQLGQGTAGTWSDFFNTATSDWLDLVQSTTAIAADWRELARVGGYPTPAIEQTTEDDRALWFQGYIETYLDRDLRDLASLNNPLDMRRLMRIAAHRVGQLVNRSAWANEAGVAPTTAFRYLDLLEQSYQLIRLEVYAVNRGKRLIKSPKAYWSDTAMAWHLAGTPPLSGFHFENVVVQDLLVWRDAQLQKPAIMHWRTTTQDEVDFVVEQPNGRLLAIECKSSDRPTHDDADGLRLFLREYPAAVGGLLLHSGTETRWIADRVLSVPWWRVM
ncbi:ATP-binding protein [Gemmatimonas sp.]|uniref:ATP-binding protein n=1 Tax=Gemmatimonas sp. TaxID=1962908 RepID=UPI00333FFC54